MGKKTLVLDLDETLIHTSPYSHIPHDFSLDTDFRYKQDLKGVGYYVSKRPGLEKFLKDMSEIYELVVFTAGTQDYADAILDIIDESKLISHRLYRQHCTKFSVKDLSKIGRDAKNTILLDNRTGCYSLQVDQGLPIASWYDNKSDTEFE